MKAKKHAKKRRKRRTILQVRRDKTSCDWGKWQSSYAAKACLNFDDCEGCGAFKKKGGG